MTKFSSMPNDDGFMDLHHSMLRVRRVEEKQMQVFADGKIPGFIHVSIGRPQKDPVCSSSLEPKFSAFL